MKRYTIILVLLVAFYPFIGGQKGCGGSIQFGEEGAVEDVAIDSSSLQGAQKIPDNTGLFPEGEGDEGEDEPGTTDIVCPDPDPNQPPTGLSYLPKGADIYMVIDAARLMKYVDQIKGIGGFSAVMGQINENIENLNLGVTAKEIAEKLDHVCFACVLAPPDASTSLKNEPFRFKVCEQLVFVDVFKEPFSLEEMILSMGAEVMKDNMGRINLTDKLLAVQAADNVVVVGTSILKDVQGSAVTYAGNMTKTEFSLMARVAPSTVSLLTTNRAMKYFRGAEFMKFFMPMLNLVKFDFESRILSALDFADRASVSMAVFDISSAEEGTLVMKAFMDMDYEEFQFLISSQKQEGVDDGSALRMDVHQGVLSTSITSSQIGELRLKLDELTAKIAKKEDELGALKKLVGDPNTDQALLRQKMDALEEELVGMRRTAVALEGKLRELESGQTAQ
jgi:hypothetical protein